MYSFLVLQSIPARPAFRLVYGSFDAAASGFQWPLPDRNAHVDVMRRGRFPRT